MATQQKKAQPEPETRKPDFVVRARQAPDSEYWVTLGVAWSFKDGKQGFSVKLQTVPTNWDGQFLLLPPLEAKDE